jgi:methyl-accepting chemotaxis protein
VKRGRRERRRHPEPMKITTKIITGYGLFIAILAGLMICQAMTIHHIQSINKTLKETNFQNAMTSLNALKSLKGMSDCIDKLFVDPDTYREKLSDYQNTYEANLKKLQLKAASGKEPDSLNRLVRSWESFVVNLTILKTSAKREDVPADLADELQRLEAHTQAVYEFTLQSMTEKVNRSEATGKTAALVLYSATLFALAIGIIISFLIYRSIANPMAQLIEGTRANAEGKLFYRLDTTRNDEFSQLAKDFNTVTHRLNELENLEVQDKKEKK